MFAAVRRGTPSGDIKDAPLTFEFDSNKVRWSIEVEMEIDGWTDWSSTYWFTVVQNRRLIESDRSNPVA